MPWTRHSRHGHIDEISGRHQICAVAGEVCSTVPPSAGRPVVGDMSEAAGRPVLLSAQMALAGTQVLGAHAQW